MARGREATAESGADAEAKAGAEGGPGAAGSGPGGGGSAGAGDAPGSEARVTEAGASGASPLIDLAFVKGLIEAVDGSGIDSLEITRAGTRVKISKTPPAGGPAPTYFATPPQPAMAPASNSPSSPAPAAPSGSAAASEPSPAPAAEPAAADAGLVEIKSPMVGTFYRSPAPEAPPYVEVGTKVSKGQTLCILEAMKLMNELESEVDGVVKDVLVENAEPVEYGQVLFRIDPNG